MGTNAKGIETLTYIYLLRRKIAENSTYVIKLNCSCVQLCTCMGLGSRGTQVSILPCFLGRKFSELRSKECQNFKDIPVGAADGIQFTPDLGHHLSPFQQGHLNGYGGLGQVLWKADKN